MENEFDKIARELIEAKKYTPNPGLWVKAKVGIKTAYMKIAVVKAAAAVVAGGGLTTAAIVYTNQSQPTTPEITEVVTPPINVDSQSIEHIPGDSMAGKTADYSDFVKPVVPETEMVQEESSTPEIEPVPKEMAASQSPAETGHESTQKNSLEEKDLPVYAPIDINPTPKPSVWLSSKDYGVKPANAQMMSLRTEPKWALEMYLSNGKPLIMDNLQPINTRYSVVSSHSLEAGIAVRRRLAKNFAIGSGLELGSFEETRLQTASYPQEISREVMTWRLDSFFIGKGFKYDSMGGIWVETDSAYFYEPIPVREIRRDTVWQSRTEQLTNTLKTIQIPLELSYELEHNRWSVRPNIGLGLAYIYDVQYAYVTGPRQEIAQIAAADIDQFLINFRGGLQARYKLGMRNYVLGGVQYSSNLSSLGTGLFETTYDNLAYQVGLGFSL